MTVYEAIIKELGEQGLRFIGIGGESKFYVEQGYPKEVNTLEFDGTIVIGRHSTTTHDERTVRFDIADPNFTVEKLAGFFTTR